MRVDVEVKVDAPMAEVWRLVSNIEGAAEILPAVEKVEVLERPGEGLQGLKWRETRTIFGKEATETMWITDTDDRSFYVTEAASHGSAYHTRVHLSEQAGATRLGMTFTAEAQSFGARFMSTIFGFLIRGATRKALAKDLEDIKELAESRSR